VAFPKSFQLGVVEPVFRIPMESPVLEQLLQLTVGEVQVAPHTHVVQPVVEAAGVERVGACE